MQLVQSEKPVGTKHEKLGEFSFPVEVPQFDSIEEASKACGGDSALLDFINGNTAVNAKNVARAYARGVEVADGTPEDQYPALIGSTVAKAQELARTYTPSSDSEKGPSKAKKAAAFDQLAALAQTQGGQLTAEQIAAFINLGR